MQESSGIGIETWIILIVIIGGSVVLLLKNSKKHNEDNHYTKKEANKEKVKESELFKNIKEIYSKYFPWQESIGTKSAYVAGEKDFADKLLKKINNEEEFFKIYNSDFINPELLQVEIDRKYDIIEELYGTPLNLAVNFDKFNIKNGTLTEKIKKLIIEWYKEGVNDVKRKIKYQVKAKDWDRVKNTLERILNS